MSTRLLILDRDGVVNHTSTTYIKEPDEWKPIDGSIEAMSQLYHANWQMVVVSNQSAIGRGLLTLENLYAIHSKMENLLNETGARIEAFFFCPHLPETRCGCRKPQPGLLLQIERRFGINLKGIPFVGDSDKDIEAARQVGARPMLVLTGNGQRTQETMADLGDVEVFADLAAVAEHLLLQEGLE